MARSAVSKSETLHALLGPPLQDAEEETFLLFSQDIPTNNLGFVDATADNIDIEIAGHEYTIQQSPGLLNSNHARGTTGAVLWKVSPLLATWLASCPTILADLHALHPDSVVAELGCGLAGLIGQVLSQSVQRYILTDQPSIVRHLRAALGMLDGPPRAKTRGSKNKKSSTPGRQDVLQVMALDWEKDDAMNLRAALPGNAQIDLLILCDCVYNEYLVKPLVQTCVDACRLGHGNEHEDGDVNRSPTVVLVAQQLRSDTIFELFLETMIEEFEVWRVPEGRIPADLGANSGYAVHLAILRGGRART
ncbi:uncharacterized protein A1O9_08871 [Exophiala aquamarina CBS 119918]|uniref:Diaminohydroxyphosphoribosylamino-pyrimidine deaminase n=1 Tax=Exophiala aquamarina CBS 119918 TaxID=1182545 RepID=A0A072P671_9EURO|nr:uncharacterized protein A1O9_08871 [Exophiala aquamarina CBS 119918]KEF55217.1 hypothetical protein A1O9_08871 [Exophiala aquamarina CBS 119918]